MCLFCNSLTRPSLSQSYIHPANPFSASELPSIAPAASLPYPTADPQNTFILGSALTLPESFQSAYVGEVFSCTICANNELPLSEQNKKIDHVKIQAEIQSPSNPTGLIVDFEDESPSSSEQDDEKPETPRDFKPGDSIQKIMKINLHEEGNHVLAITVTYTETSFLLNNNNTSTLTPSSAAGGGRVRTFRKLYQFVAQNLIGVRTKAGDFRSSSTKDGSTKKSCAVEAQLENLGERTISIEKVVMNTRAPFGAKSLNWDVFGTGADPIHSPILDPRDVLQVAFLVEDKGEKGRASEDEVELRVPEGKVALGQLNIQWRSAMGDRGSLSTGWLLGRKP